MRFASVVLTVALSAGCSVYDSSLVEQRDAGLDSGPDASADAGPEDAGQDTGIDAGPEDAGVDAGQDSGVDAGPSCDPLVAPAPGPALGGSIERVYALRDIIVDQNDGRWEQIGYDLDGVCTTVSAPMGACPTPTGEAPPVDGMRGIDNAFGKEIFSLAARHEPDLESDARADLDAGEAGVIVRIRGWNGERDDGRVDVTLAQALRGEGATDGTLPAWDGNDRFWLASTDFAGGDPEQPLMRDDTAYITDGTLVMRIPDGRPMIFPWNGGHIRMALTTGFLVARIGEGAEELRDVTITGRWALIDVRDALTAAGFCPGDIIRQIIDATVTRNADVRRDPRSDGTGAVCDALSVAIGFERGSRATIAGMETPTPAPPRCP